MLAISVPRLRTIKRSSDYLKARVAITHGIILDTESQLADIKEQRKEILTQMLPPALRVIANAVNQPPTSFPERVLQVKVAQDILDREGTFAKISRSEIRPAEGFNWASSEHSAREVISVIRGVRTSREAVELNSSEQSLETARLIEITKAFATGKTITSEADSLAQRVLEMAPPEEQED
jgi:hypothetical protein